MYIYIHKYICTFTHHNSIYRKYTFRSAVAFIMAVNSGVNIRTAVAPRACEKTSVIKKLTAIKHDTYSH